MTDYLTEQEQIEILKNWIKQYSLVILAGVVIAIIGITGWRYWQQRQQDQLNRASIIYDEMLTKRAQSDMPGTEIQAKKLLNRYPNNVYGQLAAMMLARNAINKKDYQTAEKQLNWVLTNSDADALRQIARLRLARIFIATQQPEQALKTLKTIEDKNFNGLTNEVKGDAYLALNKVAEARQSYQQALNDLPNAEVIRPLLQMKYDNLATVIPPSSSPAS